MSDFLSKFSQPKSPGSEDSKQPSQNLLDDLHMLQQDLPKSAFDEAQDKTVEQGSANNLTVKDPSFASKKRRRLMLLVALGVCSLALIGFLAYRLTHVKVPDFVGKDIAEAREWGIKHRVEVKIEQRPDFDKGINQVVKQSTSNKAISKSTPILLTTSTGPDDEEVIKLPNFKDMTLSEAKAWAKKAKANNVQFLESYHDSVAQGAYIKSEFKDKDVTEQSYRRKNRLNVSYSKGKEVYEKDIAVPDFTNKTVSEVQEWAKKQEIELIEETKDSDKIIKDNVIEQRPKKDSKLAKKEQLHIVISKGKGQKVADYAKLSKQDAQAQAESGASLVPLIKEVYHDTASYGQFISQSIEAGKVFYEEDTKPNLTVSYSAGRPYLKDFRNSLTEGELAQTFYETYQSKGANISYNVYYVYNEAPKGTVVAQDIYNEFVPINTQVALGISWGPESGESQ